MGFFKNMLSDIKTLVQGAGDGSTEKSDIQSRISAFKSLRSSLDFQWRKLEAEWKKSSSVEENLRRTPLMRVQMMRRAKSISQRMAMIGKFCNMIETFTSVLDQALALREHKAQMESAMGNAEQFRALGEEMNTLMAKNKEMLSGIVTLDGPHDVLYAPTASAATLSSTAFTSPWNIEKSGTGTLTMKTAIKGDIAGAKKVQEQISAIMTGGSTLVLA